MNHPPLKIFICYARKDSQALESLCLKLAPLKHAGEIEIWYDQDITPGKEWDNEIRFNLKAADIVLLLISDHFFASHYIKSVELDEALSRYEQGECIVVPVILHECLWKRHPKIPRIQVLPKEGNPVFDTDHWPSPDKALFDVVQGIEKILDAPETRTRQTCKIARLENIKKQEAEAAAQLAEKQRIEREKAAEAERKKAIPEMLPIPAGEFQMGSNDGEGDEKPIHTVHISAFEMGKFPVTVAQFRAFVDDSAHVTDAERGGDSYGLDAKDNWAKISGRNWRHAPDGQPAQDNHPVVNVSWNDAKAYCDWLSTKVPGKKFRLPTEAEWEYAAGNGQKHTRYSWGDQAPKGKRGGNVACETTKRRFPNWTIFEGYDSGFLFTSPVGSFEANDFGLFDMTGNVWEWCEDWYDAEFYKKSPANDPVCTKEGPLRVLRGGSWNDAPQYCRVAVRNGVTPDDRVNYTGFRLARTN